MYYITLSSYCSHRSFHSRMYFLCPHCKKAPRSLPGHLRTVCMRDRSDAEIQATVIQAKKELAEFTHRGRFWEYQSIQDILATADPLVRCVNYILCFAALSCCSTIFNIYSNVCVSFPQVVRGDAKEGLSGNKQTSSPPVPHTACALFTFICSSKPWRRCERATRCDEHDRKCILLYPCLLILCSTDACTL